MKGDEGSEGYLGFEPQQMEQIFARPLRRRCLTCFVGKESAQQIRKISGYETTPIVACTANVFENKLQGKGIFNEYMHKPCTLEDMRRILAKVLK